MTEKRLRYFDGQFLQDHDFTNEQEYHLDRERRPFKCLAVAGVCEGLTLSSSQIDQVTVAAGMAIDPQGRQIVLDAPQVVNLANERPTNTDDQKLVNVFILYNEEDANPATEGSQGYRRCHEAPLLSALDQYQLRPEYAVRLAQLTIRDNGALEIDYSFCEYSGVYLPSGNSNGATLRYQQQEGGGYPIFQGDLKVTGDVTLEQSLTVTQNLTCESSLTVMNETNIATKLAVQGDSAENTQLGDWRDAIQFSHEENGAITHSRGGLLFGLHRDRNFYFSDIRDGSLHKDVLVINADTGNGTFSGTVTADSFVGHGAIITGMIVMWSGSDANIPDGWALCDGSNGTPNLQGRFVLGAGSTYPVDQQGGQENVTLSINEMPRHNHTNGEYNLFARINANRGRSASSVDSPGYYELDLLGGGGSLNSGGSQPHDNMPPYWALCFIMKL